MRLALACAMDEGVDPRESCAWARLAGCEAVVPVRHAPRPPAGEAVARWIRATLEAGVATAGLLFEPAPPGLALFADGDELARHRLVHALLRLVETVGELGGGWLAVTVPVGPGLPPGREAEVLSAVARELHRIADHAARHRLRLLLAAAGTPDRETAFELAAVARSLDGAGLLLDGHGPLAALPPPLAVTVGEVADEALAALLRGLESRAFAGDLVLRPPRADAAGALVAARTAGFVRGFRERAG